MVELAQAEPSSLEKEAPFGQWLSQTRGFHVSNVTGTERGSLT